MEGVLITYQQEGNEMNLYTDTNGNQNIEGEPVTHSDLILLFRMGYAFTNQRDNPGVDLVTPPPS